MSAAVETEERVRVFSTIAVRLRGPAGGVVTRQTAYRTASIDTYPRNDADRIRHVITDHRHANHKPALGLEALALQ